MYPYSYEEYRNDYMGNKYLHENGISNALVNIQDEVRCTISCLLMF